jgi:hypothetical protein
VPKSRTRKKKDGGSDPKPATTAPAKKGPSPVWLVPAMLTLFGLGVLWLVVYYVSGGEAPVISDLGPWNLAIGFGFIIAGFGLSTQWR